MESSSATQPAPTQPAPTQPAPVPPPLPPGIRRSLRGFRGTMRRRKLAEVLALVVLVALVSYLGVVVLDRLVDTLPIARAALLGVTAAVALVAVPRALRRWVFRHRGLPEVAREISLRDPVVGDRLLGVFELSTDADEFARSPELVGAAIARGEKDLGGRTFDHAQPRSAHGLYLRLLVVPALAAAALAVFAPEVALNALQRWAAPFGDVPRFTFTRVAGLEGDWVVPIQEEREVALTLAAESRWRPRIGELRFGSRPLRCEREGESYRFQLPPLGSDRDALLVIGDLRERVRILPTERPEIVAASAVVALPAYLELEARAVRDVRGGSLAAVQGSSVTFELEASRALASAKLTRIHGEEAGEETGAEAPDRAVRELEPIGAALRSADSPVTPGEGARATFEWTDVLGLDGHAPFSVGVRSVPDEAPSVAASGVDREVVLLVDTAMTFDVLASDDFGVREVGLEWFEPPTLMGEAGASLGDRLLLAAGPDADRVEAFAAFRPKDVGLGSRSVVLRAWAVDSLPDRERAYSAPIYVDVMTSDEHLEWVSQRYERWLQRASEVRDRELELFAENRALFEMSDEALDQPGARSRIQSQAQAERANRARLRGLVSEGAELLNQAARNDDIGANTLDQWAETRKRLEEIAESDMESVAKLLAKAARAEAGAQGPSGQDASVAGRVLASGAASPAPEDGGEEAARPDGAMPPTPTILDVESSLVEAEAEAAPESESAPEEGEPSNRPAPIGLVGTTLGPAPGQAPPEEGAGPEVDREEPRSLTKEQLAKAIEAQKKLIEEFNSIAGEIQEVLAKLDNSTFVKRLKAASRAQTEGADGLDVALERGFGAPNAGRRDEEVKASTRSIVALEEAESTALGNLYGDLDAYADRLSYQDSETAPKFERIVEQWRETRPVLLAQDLAKTASDGRPGEARMSAQFLADTLDRWGEELVGPG